jgi:uncharacterized protein YbjT (DUF2867 family)
MLVIILLIKCDWYECPTERNLPGMNTNILVIGGSGGIGGALVQQLLDQGYRVRVSSRDPGTRKWPVGVEPVQGDLEHPDSMRAAADGIESAFLYVHGRSREVVAQLRAAGVKRVTVLSTIDAANDSRAAAYNRSRHLECEEAVADSGLAFTCLRPGAFVSNALRFFMPQLSNGNVVRLPFPDSQQAPIDTRDVARVAAIALTSGRLDGQRPVLTGPQSLTQREQIAALGQLLGRSLEIETLSVEAARASMLERIPERYVELLLGQWEEETHCPALVTSEVERMSGQAATPYAAALAWTLAQRDS